MGKICFTSQHRFFAAMNIQENISLLPYNTFGMDKKARFFVRAQSEKDVIDALLFAREKGIPLLVLGGGSNILLTKDWEGLVLKMEIKGIQVEDCSEDEVLVKVGAGENWHEFVLFCIENGYAGVENLSLIPGTVGASPMQNIGAYGVEIKEVFDSLWAIERSELANRRFSWEECAFGYRESVFKSALKDQYIITQVWFRLSKKPQIKTSYGAIQDTLKELGIRQPSIRDVSEAVIQIRRSKLPDPAEIGNAGSFFKNPTIPLEHFERLKSEYPNIPGYPGQDTVKVPAAWLIEQTGWKGKRFGSIGVHAKQPLVLVNYGGGEGKDIVKLSQDIQSSVYKKFGITLQPEVNFV
nr:UDP-N-acetylmuramate dehydrogenase [Mariniradius sediminis]